jgi:O-antigen/teichoic acid export membrane protein
MTIKERFVGLLRKSEKITKTDMVYVTKNGGWLLFGTILQSFLSLILAISFANLLPKVTYGIYQYALSIASILAISTLAGISTSIAHATAQNKGGAIFSAVKSKISWGIVGSTISCVLAVYYFFNDNSLLGSIFLIVALFVPLSEGFSIYTGFLQGKKDFKRLTLFETTIQGIATVALIITLFLTKNVLIITVVYFLSWTIARIIFYKLSIHIYKPEPIQDAHMVSYGKHLSVMSLMGTISSNTDKLLLWHFLGPTQVAIYTFSLAIPLRINGFTKIINRLAFPKLVEKTDGQTDYFLLQKIIRLSLFLVVITVLYIIAVPFIYKLLFPQYLESIPYAQIAGLLIVFQPVMLISTTLIARARKKDLYIFNITSPITKAVLFILLIPTLGILGAVLGLVGSKIADTVILLALFKRIKTEQASLPHTI